MVSPRRRWWTRLRPDPWRRSEYFEPRWKRSEADRCDSTVLAPGINPAQGVFIEAFITAVLCLAVLMLAAEKHIATPFAPVSTEGYLQEVISEVHAQVGVGLTLFICELFAVYYTGGAVNTARAFGPAVVTGFPHGTHWVVRVF